jgi:DNA-nicking Smr family endonuclease
LAVTKAKTAAVKSLADLASMRDALHAAEQAAAIAKAKAALEAAQKERERNQFAHAVGKVQPVKVPPKAHLPKPLPAPEPLQRMADEAAALKEALSDEVDLESLLLTDDGLSYRRPEVPIEVVVKLRKGHWAIQQQLDLHGLRSDEAREALAGFIRLAHQNGQRCLRVVHGKGHGSPGKQPVLKAKVQRWLAQRQEVIAFAQASGPQGGAGALIVLLAGRVR